MPIQSDRGSSLGDSAVILLANDCSIPEVIPCGMAVRGTRESLSVYPGNDGSFHSVGKILLCFHKGEEMPLSCENVSEKLRQRARDTCTHIQTSQAILVHSPA